MEVNREKIRYILQFFFDKGENTSQTAEIVNDAKSSDIIKVNYVQFWFRRFYSGILAVKNVDKIIKALAKQNEMNPFHKQKVNEDEKWAAYDIIERKRSASKSGDAVHMVAKP
ncbi:hypothetical protein TNCV_2085641 [Trichonephila clavipes]|nr:hypothetical protein TNCV_2085641 [Trichonephila clavipes]